MHFNKSGGDEEGAGTGNDDYDDNNYDSNVVMLISVVKLYLR